MAHRPRTDEEAEVTGFGPTTAPDRYRRRETTPCRRRRRRRCRPREAWSALGGGEEGVAEAMRGDGGGLRKRCDLVCVVEACESWVAGQCACCPAVPALRVAASKGDERGSVHRALASPDVFGALAQHVAESELAAWARAWLRDDAASVEAMLADESGAARVELRGARRGGDDERRRRAIVTVHAVDATEEHRLREAAYRRDIVDHRLGNLTRTNQLLLEAHKYAQLAKSLELVKTEIDIRRGIEDQLSTDPVSLGDLVAPVAQSVCCRFVGGLSETALLRFYAGDGAQIPFQVLQVKVLLDIFSNVFKHGDCACDVSVSPDGLAFANAVKIRNPPPRSARTGLHALRHECRHLGLDIAFDRTETTFTARLAVSVELVQPLLDDDDRARPNAPDDLARRARAYTWILVEDQPVLANLWTTRMRKLGIDLVALCSPPDVANLSPTVAYHRRCAPDKPLVLIMDENVACLDDDFDAVPVTSTALRAQLMTDPALRDAWTNRRLFFVLASASDVPPDQYVLADIGKAGSTLTMLRVILDAISPDHHHLRKPA